MYQLIGRRCVSEMIKLAAEKGMDNVIAYFYAFNIQSQRMFASIGLYMTDEEWYRFDIN